MKYLPTIKKKHLRYLFYFLFERLRQLYCFLFSTQKDTPYKGRFMTRLEQMKLLDAENTGIAVNGYLRLSPTMCFRHLCITGSTGSGKSSIIFVPSIMSIDDPLFILDCSGALYDQTSGYLKKKGFSIHRINLSKPQNGSDS